MEKEGLVVNGRAPHGSRPRGETGAVQLGGGSVVTVACGTDFYHNVGDRWPEAVAAGLWLGYARAFANGALGLAQQT